MAGKVLIVDSLTSLAPLIKRAFYRHYGGSMYKAGDIIRHNRKGTEYVILETPAKAKLKAAGGWEPAYIYSSYRPETDTSVRYSRTQAEVEDSNRYTFVRGIYADES